MSKNSFFHPDPSVSTRLFSGVDHISLDKRDFTLAHGDIENCCDFFSIGKLKHYQKEKNVIISHSNFFVYVETNQGEYALKFYPATETRSVKNEYIINRFLISRHFSTPAMLSDHDGIPFLKNGNRIITCSSYINGQQAWQVIKKVKMINKINSAMLTIKDLLKQQHLTAFRKQENLIQTSRSLVRSAGTLSPFNGEKAVKTSIQNILRTFRQNSPLYTRQLLHNNASLTNFIVSKETVYTLDLFHIREDYSLSDLANMVVSCLLLEIPVETIQTVIQDYFNQHQLKQQEYASILSSLVQLKLAGELLKNVAYEKQTDFSQCPKKLSGIYRLHLMNRIESLLFFLQPKALDQLL